MTIDRTKLKRLALAATPGPWSANVIGGIVHYRLPSFDCAEIANTMDSPNPISDAAFIGFSDPPTVLALLDRIAALEAGLSESLGLLATTRKYWTSHNDHSAYGASIARLRALADSPATQGKETQ